MFRFIIISYLFCFIQMFICFSNERILWERVPTLGPSHFFSQKCLFSSDGKYIITVHPDWLSVFDAETGKQINNKYFNPANKDEHYGIDNFFVNNYQNVICCKYFNSDGYCGIRYYDIPSLNVIETFSMPFWFDSFSSDLRLALMENFPQYNSFLIYDIFEDDTLYIDSAYIYNPPPDNRFTSRFFFSKDSKFLIAAVNYDSILDISVFNINEKKMINHYSVKRIYGRYIENITISNDFEYIVTTTYEYISIYKLQTGELVRNIYHPQIHDPGVMFPIEYTVISNNNKFIASQYEYYKIKIYDIETGNIVHDINCCKDFKNPTGGFPDARDYIHLMVFSKDDNKLIACGFGVNYLIDVNTGNLISILSSHYIGESYEDKPGFIKFVNNDEYLITKGNSETIIWDAKTGAFIKAINFSCTAPNGINTIAIHPDTKHLINSNDTTIYFYNFIDEELSDEITTTDDVLYLDISGNGRYLGYTMKDSTFAVYDLQIAKVILSSKEKFTNDPSVTDIRLSGIKLSDEKYCAVKSDYGVNHGELLRTNTTIYNFKDCKLIESSPFNVEFFTGDSMIFEWTPNWNIIYIDKYSSENNNFNLYKKFEGNNIKSAVPTADGKFLITSGPTIWNIETGDSIHLHAEPELNDMDYVAVSNNGKMLAAMSPEGRIVVWDVEDLLTDVNDKRELSNSYIFKVFPNPFSGRATIEFYIDKSTTIDLKVCNSLGQVVYTDSHYYDISGKQSEIIDLQDLPAGVYFILLIYNGRIETGRIIKY
jgi:hypothetical protein